MLNFFKNKKVIGLIVVSIILLGLAYKKILDGQVIASIITAIVTMVVVFITSKSNNEQTEKNIQAMILQAKINSKTVIEQSRSQRNIETITKNRIEWMQTLKEYISEYVAIVENYIICDQVSDFVKRFMKISIIATKINLHLNFIGIKDKEILDKINLINGLILKIYKFDTVSDKRECLKEICLNEIKLLIIYIQIYLKTEWERVKFESENGNANKFNFNEEFDKYKAKKSQDIKKIENNNKKIKY